MNWVRFPASLVFEKVKWVGEPDWPLCESYWKHLQTSSRCWVRHSWSRSQFGRWRRWSPRAEWRSQSTIWRTSNQVKHTLIIIFFATKMYITPCPLPIAHKFRCSLKIYGTCLRLPWWCPRCPPWSLSRGRTWCWAFGRRPWRRWSSARSEWQAAWWRNPAGNNY